MKTFVAVLYRDLTCAAASAIITLIFAMSVVESTSVPPGTHAATATVTARASLEA